MRSRRVRTALAATVAGIAVVALSVAAWPSLHPASPAAPGSAAPSSLPACAVGDEPAAHRGYDEVASTLLDTTFELDPSYVPPDLVHPDGSPFRPGASASPAARGQPAGDAADAAVRAIVRPDLVALRDAASRAGARLVVLSGYRSYEEQRATFDYWVGVGGYGEALRTSARPGHSEHQLGTAIDFGDGGGAPWDSPDWATTPTGAWLAAHAFEYGFVMSYPTGKMDVTCYAYEPWHYRWVGREVAAKVRASGLTLREYLWRR